MPYIVDGNNVMGQIPGWHRDKSAARERLLFGLATFSKQRSVRITVVFDGGADDRFPEGSAFKGVKILYAERGSDADRRIQRLVEAASDPRGITVVTSDRHLALLVKSRGAKTVRSGEFRRTMEAYVENAGCDPLRTMGGNLEEWMRYFGADPSDDEEQADGGDPGR